MPPIAAVRSRAYPRNDCQGDCACRCHTRSRDVQLIPPQFRSWLGQLNLPRSLIPAIWSLAAPCDRPQCARGRNQVQSIKYTAPTWFARVEGTIRFEAIPIHFHIQSPRVVESLHYLQYVNYDEFRRKISTRELTLHDVDTDGRSVLHVSFKATERGYHTNIS